MRLGLESELTAYPRVTTDTSPLRSYGFGANGMAQETHLLHYIRIVYRRRWLAGASFVAVMVGAAVYVWTTTPTYEARAQLMIEDERAQVVVFKDAVTQADDKGDYQQTQLQILQSRDLARSTLNALAMWDVPEFTGVVNEKDTGGARRIVDRGVAMLNSVVERFSKSKPVGQKEGHTADEPAKTAAVIDAFLSRLTVEPVRNSRLVDVKFQSIDPDRAASIANALVKTYIQQNSAFRSKSSKEAFEFLGQQLETQRTQVKTSEAALQKYREQTDAVSSGEREAMLQQKLNEMSAAQARARTDRIQKEILFNQVEAVGKPESALQNVPAIVANPVMQNLNGELVELRRQEVQLAETLGERHPDRVKLRHAIDAAQERLQAEAVRLTGGIRSDYLAAKRQEETFVNAIEDQKREAQAMRRKATAYDALAREAASDRQIFESLLQRTKETGVSSELLTSNSRIIDAADIPRSPVYPQKGTDLFLAALGGSLLSVCAAFFVHYLDKAVKTPEQVKSELGLPCLALVPAIGTSANDGEPALLSPEVSQLFKESFRTLRTNMLFASSEQVPHTLLVASTGPHEGKTLVASNLAVALAQTGRRVLLIDADLRRPKLHTVFNCDQEPGLSTLAMGPCDPAASAMRSSIRNLWLLPAGPVPPDSAEILSSETFGALVKAASLAFDWVIIDSAPVMAVTDAALIANVVGAVLFVVGADVTRVPNALNALEQLDAARAKFAGAVLNRVTLEKNAFFYADHYRREYKEYYGVGSTARHWNV